MKGASDQRLTSGCSKESNDIVLEKNGEGLGSVGGSGNGGEVIDFSESLAIK